MRHVFESISLLLYAISVAFQLERIELVMAYPRKSKSQKFRLVTRQRFKWTGMSGINEDA